MTLAVQPAAAPSQKERFLTFAFAASDLLVEIHHDGTIAFADGAFKARFGVLPGQLIGRPLRQLFCTSDHTALDLAIAKVLAGDRISQLILRLSDPDTTLVVVSGLAMPTVLDRLCFTIGQVPALPSSENIADPRSFAGLTEAKTPTEEGKTMGLVEAADWTGARLALPADAQRALGGEINEVLARLGGAGIVAEEVSHGRFGVVSRQRPDMRLLAETLESILRGHAGTARTQLQAAGLSLDRSGLTGAQAARALRFALARFASGGTEATNEAGFRDGLADFISSAESRARDVRSSIADGQFRLAFQPVVNLVTLEVHHYEALLRPTFTSGGPIQNTQEFVTFAEAVGLSEELDWAVMQQALQTLKDHPDSVIAVNVSGLSMQSPRFRELVLSALEDTSGLEGRLLVELTETAEIEDTASAATSINCLRAAKVPICIDDFGAGSAAFRYLREFRVDYVKLDGAYVRGALHNAREHGFLLSMVELANFVGAKVIAETIETEPEAALMREVGVEYGQGWLFGRPGGLPKPRCGTAKFASALSAGHLS